MLVGMAAACCGKEEPENDYESCAVRSYRITGELAGRRLRPLLAKLPVSW